MFVLCVLVNYHKYFTYYQILSDTLNDFQIVLSDILKNGPVENSDRTAIL